MARNFAATNEPGTCFWCGRNLPKDQDPRDHFDIADCARLYANTLANAGRRLKPVVPEVVEVES